MIKTISLSAEDELARVESVIEAFVSQDEWGNEPPEDNGDWRDGFRAAQQCLREDLKPWWPFAKPLSLSRLTTPTPQAGDAELARELELHLELNDAAYRSMDDALEVPLGLLRRILCRLTTDKERVLREMFTRGWDACADSANPENQAPVEFKAALAAALSTTGAKP